jgi:hypothetical protein
VLINGLPELPIAGIRLDSLSIHARQGVTIIDADSITLNQCSIHAITGPILSVNEGRQVTVNGGRWTAPAGASVRIEGPGSSAIRLLGISPAIEYGRGAKLGTVTLQ